MYEMQAIATYDRGVCLSVCLSRGLTRLTVQNGWTDQDAVCGEHSWGLWNSVLEGDPDPPQRVGGGVVENWPYLFQKWLNVKISILYAKVGHRGLGLGHMT